MSDVSFWKVGFKGVLGGRFFLVEGGASRVERDPVRVMRLGKRCASYSPGMICSGTS